jgi:hypothetical protein
MFKSIHRRLSYANVAATLALVFAMSGGALAAKSYLINSINQINPKVAKKLKGNTGKAGATGATGANGASGATGATGATGKEGPSGKEGKEGKEGPRGPSEGLQGFKDIVGFLPSKMTAVGSLAVPAGNYLASAKLYVNDQGTERAVTACILSNDVTSDSDQTEISVDPIGATGNDGRAVIVLQAATSMGVAGHWIVSCLANAEKIKAEHLKIHAIGVATVSNGGA